MQELPLTITCRRHHCKAQTTINTIANRQGLINYMCVDNGWAFVKYEGCQINRIDEDYFIFCPDCSQEAKDEAQAALLKQKHN